jgi:hypothetical protein
MLQPVTVLQCPIPPSAWPSCQKKRRTAVNDEAVEKDQPTRKSEKFQRRSAESESSWTFVNSEANRSAAWLKRMVDEVC